MDGTEATERLFAEVIALRLVTQRLAAQLGTAFGDMTGFLAHEHAGALDDLTRFEINDQAPDRRERIRARAESVIDQIYSVMREGEPPQKS